MLESFRDLRACHRQLPLENETEQCSEAGAGGGSVLLQGHTAQKIFPGNFQFPVPATRTERPEFGLSLSFPLPFAITFSFPFFTHPLELRKAMKIVTDVFISRCIILLRKHWTVLWDIFIWRSSLNSNSWTSKNALAGGSGQSGITAHTVFWPEMWGFISMFLKEWLT